MYTKQLQNNFTQDTFHLMLPDRDALREVSSSNQERLHTFITNTAENNYLKPLLSNWLVWCLLILTLDLQRKMQNTQRWPFCSFSPCFVINCIWFMVRVSIHTVLIHALDGLMQQKYLLCSAALPSHPILPCQLNSNVVETATFSGQGAVPGNESWCVPAPHSSTLPSLDLCQKVVCT